MENFKAQASIFLSLIIQFESLDHELESQHQGTEQVLLIVCTHYQQITLKLGLPEKITQTRTKRLLPLKSGGSQASPMRTPATVA